MTRYIEKTVLKIMEGILPPTVYDGSHQKTVSSM